MCGADVRLVPPRGRARKPVPSEEPQAAEGVPAGHPWRQVTWRQGTKGPLGAKFAATRVRVADGPVWGNNRHLPGSEFNRVLLVPVEDDLPVARDRDGVAANMVARQRVEAEARQAHVHGRTRYVQGREDQLHLAPSGRMPVASLFCQKRAGALLRKLITIGKKVPIGWSAPSRNGGVLAGAAGLERANPTLQRDVDPAVLSAMVAILL